LPAWEFENLLSELERQNAKEQLDLLTIYCAGFSGNSEILQQIEQQLTLIRDSNLIFTNPPPDSNIESGEEPLSFSEIWGFEFDIPMIGA
jgi:hypothetical protein